MSDGKKLAWLAGIFLAAYFLPLENTKVTASIYEALRLLQWYAVNHTLACVVPAMFIAGAISTFLSQASVMKYLGPTASRPLAYTVASVSGVVLAVCSCSVLPMFAGIYKVGAGIGPASAFLYSGPAINVMAVFLSARVLGMDLGVARAAGAIAFAFVIGIIMSILFRRQEAERTKAAMQLPEAPKGPRKPWQTSLYFLAMILFLVFSDWYNTNDVAITMKVHGIKWYLAGVMGLMVLLMLWKWFSREEIKEWLVATKDFGLMIVPLLFGGVFFTGFIGGLIPEKAVAGVVGGNSLLSNFTASFAGAVWYFATLTEIPIVEMLMRLGMGKGPALSLLLAGPALSLPSVMVIYRVIGFRKTAAFCLQVVVVSTIVGWIFGMFFG